MLIFSLLLAFACKDNTECDCENGELGILKNFTGLDGCGWIIQVNDSTRLEPVNLDDFEIELEENKAVCIRYHEELTRGSYCQVGKVVEIICIEPVN